MPPCIYNSIVLYTINISSSSTSLLFFFFKNPATTEIYTLSLHDALPICAVATGRAAYTGSGRAVAERAGAGVRGRSEEHTSELQSQSNLVCRLLLEKKKKIK